VVQEKRITTRIAKAVALSWKQQCKDLLDALWRCEDSSPFRMPVNIIDHPDYLQAIDHPMDLQTIREQMQVRTGIYGTLVSLSLNFYEICYGIGD